MFKLSKEGMATIGIYAVMIMVICVLAFSGCAKFDNELMNELAVEAATARVLHEHPQWKDNVLWITSAAASAIDGKVLSDLASVESYVKEQINWNDLLPEEQALVNVLIGQVKTDLEKSFKKQGAKPEEQLIQVKQVLEWINLAAQN